MLNSLIKKVRKDSKNIEDIIVLGDFNIDLNQLSKDTHVNNFLGKLTELGLSPCVTHPTRVVSVVLQDGSMKHTNTLIDNVLATKLYNTVLLPWSISDHLPVVVNDLFTINSLTKKKEQLTYKKRTFNQDNIIKYQNRLLSIEIPMPHEPIDPEAIFTNLSEAFEYAFPLEEKFFKCNKFSFPWLTKGIQTSMKNKIKLFKKLKSHFDLANYELHKK